MMYPKIFILSVWMVIVLFGLQPAAMTMAQGCPKIDHTQTIPGANSDSSIAAQYAPILWFDNAERYLPTIPFFTAFQWRQRAGNDTTAGAFFDPQKIWPDSSWHDLLREYNNQFQSSTKPDVWVFWDKKSMSPKEFCKIITSDRQFKQRERAYMDRLKQIKSIEVLRYWMYYLNDTGLQGHPQDIEFVYVFKPKWQDDGHQPKQFVDCPLAIVGAGHTETIPNNVLLSDQSLSSPVIIIERGGHSSAPDRNGDGVFNPGFDANWRAAKLWGTRDTQAAVGLGALGNYESWMTFPRLPEDRYFPPRIIDSKNKLKCYKLHPVRELCHLYDDISRIPDHLPIGAKDTSLWLQLGKDFEKLGGPPNKSWLAISDSVRWATLNRLKSWNQDQWLYHTNSFTGKLEKRTSDKLRQERHKIWCHDYYQRSPGAIFKRHLFPPNGRLDHWLRGLYFRYPGKKEFISGLVLHVTEPPYVRDLLNLPGVLILEGGWVVRRETHSHNQVIGRLLYDFHYATMFSGYLGWGMQTNLKKYPRTYDTRKYLYGGVKAEYFIGFKPLNLNFIEIRAGVRILEQGAHLLGEQTRIELQLGLHR